jgi:hypothetical protein
MDFIHWGADGFEELKKHSFLFKASKFVHMSMLFNDALNG